MEKTDGSFKGNEGTVEVLVGDVDLEIITSSPRPDLSSVGVVLAGDDNDKNKSNLGIKKDLDGGKGFILLEDEKKDVSNYKASSSKQRSWKKLARMKNSEVVGKKNLLLPSKRNNGDVYIEEERSCKIRKMLVGDDVITESLVVARFQHH